jgi:hypothetical protein
MHDVKFASLIRRLEGFAADRPALYRLRVGLLAAVGYLYLLFIVLMLLGIVAVTLYTVRFNAATIKILWIPLALVGLVLRSLGITNSRTRRHAANPRASTGAV